MDRHFFKMMGMEEEAAREAKVNVGLKSALESDLETFVERTPVESFGSAQGRYRARIKKFVQDKRPYPRLRHHVLWLLHNCVAHPVLAVLPDHATVEFHELTSQWLNHREPNINQYRILHFKVPAIPDRALWFLHNAVAHVGIGLFPSKATFDFHDWSAEKMNVPGWV